MLLEVRRELVPIGMTSDQWELRPYSQVVWKHDGAAHVYPVTVPHDYVRGLLSTYIDGTKVDIPTFDAALGAIGCTRRDIEQAIG